MLFHFFHLLIESLGTLYVTGLMDVKFVSRYSIAQFSNHHILWTVSKYMSLCRMMCLTFFANTLKIETLKRLTTNEGVFQ